MGEISLRMVDGTHIVVPSSLEAFTTYVILEQEKWFEKETAFLSRWLKPGMTAIDIGANLGVYSLPMARLVGPKGQVFSYEPATATCRLLEISKAENGADNLHVIPAALSDGEREGHLVLGASSELHTLEGDGPGESVRITSLDAEEKARNWGAIDFIKIDAEGEEERILAGAGSFFSKRSPLVMFEVRAKSKQNDNLPAAFNALGFATYRLLPGAPVLVPAGAEELLDHYELNLFAAKPDRAAALAEQGLLIEAIPEWAPDDEIRAKALEFFKAQPFAPIFAALPGGGAALEPAYRDALAGYAMWRSRDLSLSERYAALRFAGDTLTALCDKQASLPRLSTLARITWEMGRRTISVKVLGIMADVLKRGTGRIMEPFWPANPRFDHVPPGANAVEWFVVAALEQFEQTAFQSSRFGSSGVDLDWLSKQPLASTEIERRRILQRALAGQKNDVPPRLLAPAPDHLNAEAWRGGLVPNTIVGR
ncbi:FkbM family methyltransferase [Bradyrhizobium canariense]|uniref:Methyltransferase, FkbM family n=1 Tax=Bradyrhizobium canariense TaxID=255045 RepID=A0A1H1P4R2_9BRAD|nr:FkbM family methyltransferase [Bradyrhizobium canariense]SDS06177.1 methyltransferase, FkbM family [Bradyrhizobium canariense]